MKNVVFVLMAAVFCLVAAEPVLEVSLNQDDFGKIVLEGTLAQKMVARVVKANKMAWNGGRLGGKALYFTEADRKTKTGFGSISIAKNGAIDFTKPFTVCCWICPDKGIIRTQQYTIIGDVNGDRGPGWRFFISYDALRFSCGDGKVATGIASTPARHPIEKGVWNHVAATWDGTTARLYMNGALASESKPEKPMVMLPGSKTISIGSYRDGTAYGFLGAISDVTFFDVALTPKEMALLAKEIKL